MKLTDERRKALTEYLGECWHETFGELQKDTMFFTCQKCSKVFQFADTELGIQRTFDNRNDLMDLYEQIEKDGKWDEFFWFSASRCNPKRDGLGCSETTAWLFCLDGNGYEDRCKMIAEFYGWRR